MHHYPSLFGHPKEDVVAGVVVFLVALPLCLGIAIACGVPPVSGLIAGVVGGLVVPWISRSPLSVTGPAAGLTSIVLVEVTRLGGIPPFLTAVLLAGVLQAAFGILRLGRFSALVPSAVIKGMLAAIGITIVWKQLPVAFGVNGGLNDIPGQLHPGAVLIAACSLAILYGWPYTPLAKNKMISPALVAVVGATLLAQFVGGSRAGPDGRAVRRGAAWRAERARGGAAASRVLGGTQGRDVGGGDHHRHRRQHRDAAVAAGGRPAGPAKRRSPPDRELLAQGAANTVSGFLGGLPVTAVIVRSGANVAAGGRERLSALVHGVLLLVAVLFAGPVLNMIPLACLAAVLIQVGLNLCKPALFATQVRLGLTQFLPFAITIAAVLALDLLKGVIVGIVVGIIFVLNENARRAVIAERDEQGVWRCASGATARSSRSRASCRPSATSTMARRCVIDGTGEYIDHDVKEVLATFVADARHRQST